MIAVVTGASRGGGRGVALALGDLGATILDLLVANAWGGYEGEQETFDAPFLQQPPWRLDRMLETGLLATYTSCVHAVRLMLPQGGGLIVGTTLHSGPHDWDLDRDGPIGVEFFGRVVAALATDSNVLERTGQLYRAVDLGRAYGLEPE